MHGQLGVTCPPASTTRQLDAVLGNSHVIVGPRQRLNINRRNVATESMASL